MYQVLAQGAQNTLQSDEPLEVLYNAKVWRAPGSTPVFQVQFVDQDGRPLNVAPIFLTLPKEMLNHLKPRKSAVNPTEDPADFTKENLDITVKDQQRMTRVYRVFDRAYENQHPGVQPALTFVVQPVIPDDPSPQDRKKQPASRSSVSIYVCFSDGQILGNDEDNCVYRMDWPNSCSDPSTCKPWVSDTTVSSVPFSSSVKQTQPLVRTPELQDLHITPGSNAAN